VSVFVLVLCGTCWMPTMPFVLWSLHCFRKRDGLPPPVMRSSLIYVIARCQRLRG
jgi:hypothetical protein